MASSSNNCWDEVLLAKKENRREINLQGSDINKRILKKGLDHNVFSLTNLYLLKISGTPLTSISSDIGNLEQLTRITLENNKLEELPVSIGNLTMLKSLDISGNKLQYLPDSFSNLVNLQSLNANLNCLKSFPNVSRMTQLAYLSIARNELSSLPDGIYDPSLSLLSTIDAAHNQIESISPEISQLCHLLKLDVTDNKLDTLPLELCECPKLKELHISENKMKDKRFLKLADHSTKALLTHLSSLLEKQRVAEHGGKAKKGGKSKKKKTIGSKEVEDLTRDVISTLKFDCDNGLTVSVMPGALSTRPYIVCCIIRNLNFGKSNNMFKRFIALQTKLHDSVCDKRQAATIATHDLKLIKGPLVYDSAVPTSIHISPLSKKKTTADVLMKELHSEADAYRKLKKRQTLSGIHQYLNLLKDKPEYPYLRDAEGDCISLPPITNSDKTKISKETTDILVEVTGPKNLDTCKTVMEELLKATLLTGVGTPSIGGEGTDVAPSNAEEGECEQGDDEAVGAQSADKVKVPQTLTVEQVKVVDIEGRLRVIYPGRNDLSNPAFDVTRNYD